MVNRGSPGSGRPPEGRRWRAAAIVLLALAGCAGQGPITDCVVADARGNQWQGSDATPLGAEEAARIACGRDSPEPSSCVVRSCQGRW